MAVNILNITKQSVTIILIVEISKYKLKYYVLLMQIYIFLNYT